jgi:hypothetical protein
MRNMKAYLPPLLIAAALGGCATPAPTPAPRVVHVWESPAAEFPPICLLMRDDGSLAFKGGFQFYQPGSWRHDARTGMLTVTLGGNTPFPLEITRVQLRSKIGALAGYNEQRRELTYKVGTATPFIALGNFYFYRSDTCHAT